MEAKYRVDGPLVAPYADAIAVLKAKASKPLRSAVVDRGHTYHQASPDPVSQASVETSTSVE
jgi:hypothetical protein